MTPTRRRPSSEVEVAIEKRRRLKPNAQQQNCSPERSRYLIESIGSSGWIRTCSRRTEGEAWLELETARGCQNHFVVLAPRAGFEPATLRLTAAATHFVLSDMESYVPTISLNSWRPGRRTPLPDNFGLGLQLEATADNHSLSCIVSRCQSSLSCWRSYNRDKR